MKKCSRCGGFAIVVFKDVWRLLWRCLSCGDLSSTAVGEIVVLYPS